MMLYRPVPYKDEDDLEFSPSTSYREAVEIGNEYYPEGYDIEEIDTDEM